MPRVNGDDGDALLPLQVSLLDLAERGGEPDVSVQLCCCARAAERVPAVRLRTLRALAAATVVCGVLLHRVSALSFVVVQP